VKAALVEITSQARASGAGLALGTCFVEAADGHCYHQIRFYRADGEFLGFHSKTLRCGSMTDPPKGRDRTVCRCAPARFSSTSWPV